MHSQSMTAISRVEQLRYMPKLHSFKCDVDFFTDYSFQVLERISLSSFFCDIHNVKATDIT